ncbi:DUF2726 domain-containing protein [Hafnia paralvei]|uniref:DUF2726 domain-containing protein n=1 Tax=Hafnia paralvei TaxID=546367 RepID=UPI000DF35C65|nr:DUF2726 domain-containing protein [Hafnia paralvei]RDA62926.1 DUF2726 domain-containing protein [Hafnia paralvei]RDA64441.1 DUF2726 domain-containing protein [Hafnia paralvei]RDA65157.1 DUF2726 domain-containing protein [Hafnia paralvei]RDA75926.1 DUF2726 domain-containing protein [Hafnia paralvei]RDA76487.1 DUF2726 domain-containing protein [Hafnia paralvei]
MVIIFFLVLIAAMFIALYKYSKIKNKESKNKKIKMSDVLIKNDDECYVKKQFLTNNERMFYKELMKVIGSNNYIMAQVRLVDIIKPNDKFKFRSKEYLSLFRKISQWHCDFVILDKESLDVIYVIELDDSSHRKENRIERDRFFNQALGTAGVKLLRVYNIDEFKNAMKETS